MFKLPNWKQFLWIVVFATISVLLRHAGVITANWIWWVLAIVFVTVYGFLKKSPKEEGDTAINEEHIKEEGRYYFYNNRCSFKLPMDAETKVLRVEKEGMKHTLMTDDGRMFIIEIRPGMPNFGSYNVQTFNTTVAGYPCLVAKPSIIRQYYINCKKFVVQVDMAPEPDEDFLNSFRLAK